MFEALLEATQNHASGEDVTMPKSKRFWIAAEFSNAQCRCSSHVVVACRACTALILAGPT